MNDNHFTLTGLAIVIFDKRDHPVWTLRSNTNDGFYTPNQTIAIGETITLSEGKKYTVLDVQLVKLMEGWQVNIRVDDTI